MEQQHASDVDAGSTIVSPKPSCSDFCSITDARRREALTSTASWQLRITMRSSLQKGIQRSYPQSGSSVATLPTRTNVESTFFLAIRKASIHACSLNMEIVFHRLQGSGGEPPVHRLT